MTSYLSNNNNMSLVHKNSASCAIDQLELFSPLSTCAQVERSISVPHYSITSISSGTNIIEFVIQGSGDQYVDLAKTKLALKLKITKGATTPLAVEKPAVGTAAKVDAAQVAPINNIQSSVFSQCDLFLNGKLVTSSNSLYAHRAYLEQVLNYSKETAKAQLTSQLFYLDESAKFALEANKGFKSRQSAVEGSKTIDVIGPLFTDLTSQPRYMLNNVEIRVKLSKNSNNFCVMDLDTTSNSCQLHIVDAVLYVQKVNVNPSVQIALEQVLRKRNAIYNIHRTDMKSFTIPKDNLAFSREHISLGLCPKYAIVGFVETEAMQGHRKKNPFDFQHFNLKQISMNVDGEQIPLNGINCDYAGEQWLEGYQSLVDIVGKWRTDQPMMFDRSEYPNGFALYGFQLVPELVQGAFNLTRNTNVRLDIKFSTALTVNVTALIWFSYDSVLEVTSARDVFYDFGA